MASEEKREMRKRTARVAVAAALVAVLLLAIMGPAVLAQNYSFNLSKNIVNLFINGDGTVQIVYDLTFANDPGAPPIDVVDIGMPNSTYQLSQITASVGGAALTNISNSPYVKPGIAVDLGSHAIPPGQTGTLHVVATVTNMIYQDTQDSTYASIEFAPTWFGSQFVHGVTNLEVSFHFPPGVTSQEPRYHGQAFTSASIQDDRVVYTWIDTSASGSQKYVFGASFPQKYLAAGVVQKTPAFTFNLGAVCSSPFWLFLLFGGGWALLAVLGSRSQKRRKMQYMPPSLAVEGAGIKRGLTAVEAAILLEAPLNKVLAMILFGLVKKGVVTVESEKPLRVKAADPLPQDANLWYYERRFLQAIQPNGTLDEKELREMAVDMIGDVNKKLAGFSYKETKAYYKDIAARAWQQVETAGTPQELGQRWGDGLEWTMLDEDWGDHTRRVFTGRPVVMPAWWWFYRPWVAHAGPAAPSMPGPMPSGGGVPVTLPTLPGADFANTVVTGVENAANTVVSSIENFTNKVTGTTNPPPKSSSSGGRGGGYGCACACACAGCACACAGGGR
jgi:hypothetical protein